MFLRIFHCSPLGTLLRAFTTLALTTLLASCGTNPQELSGEAEATLASGDLPGAIVLYEALVREDPDDLVLQTRLALLLIRQGDTAAETFQWKVAEERYARAWGLGKEAVETGSLLPKLALARDAGGFPWADQAEVLEALAGTGDLAAQAKLAQGWVRAGDPERARAAYSALVAASPEDANALMSLAQLVAESGQKDLAIGYFKRVLELQSNSVAARGSLADLLEETGAVDESEELRVEIAEAAPDRPFGWKNLKSFYERQNNLEGVARVQGKLDALAPKEVKKRPLR